MTNPMGLTNMTFRTSDEMIREISVREGFRSKAYRPIPGKNPDGSWKSNLTIGYGQENALFPGTPGEIQVTEGLTIDRALAWEALCHFVYNVVDPLVTEHCNPQTQDEHDACASWVYSIKHDRLIRGEYTLPKLIAQADRGPEALQAINDCWVHYCLTPGGESGIYRRRLLELVEFYGLPKTEAVLGWAMSARVARLDKGETLENAGYVHPKGQFAATVSPDFVLEVADAAVRPKTENEITADLNNAQLEKLGGKVGQKVATPRPPPAAKPKAAAKAAVPAEPALPPVDATLPPKPMEESKTYKAVSRADRGKETAIIGTLTGTGVTAAAANAERVGSLIEKFKPETFFIMAGMIGVFLVVMGLIMWWSGRNEAYHRRQHTQDPKY